MAQNLLTLQTRGPAAATAPAVPWCGSRTGAWSRGRDCALPTTHARVCTSNMQTNTSVSVNKTGISSTTTTWGVVNPGATEGVRHGAGGGRRLAQVQPRYAPRVPAGEISVKESSCSGNLDCNRTMRVTRWGEGSCRNGCGITRVKHEETRA